MAKIFEELECWEQAAELDANIYRLIKSCAIKSEFRLRDQMLSSSGSIADNIAEGFERGGNKEFIQFLFVAKGSCGELRSQIHRSKRRDLIDQITHKDFVEKCRNVSGKISNLISYLKTSELKGSKFT